MERARWAAFRLAARSVVAITQGGKVVVPGQAKGPLRIALPRDGNPRPFSSVEGS